MILYTDNSPDYLLPSNGGYNPKKKGMYEDDLPPTPIQPLGHTQLQPAPLFPTPLPPPTQNDGPQDFELPPLGSNEAPPHM